MVESVRDGKSIRQKIARIRGPAFSEKDAVKIMRISEAAKRVVIDLPSQ